MDWRDILQNAEETGGKDSEFESTGACHAKDV
jgi:hypothetical protein